MARGALYWSLLAVLTACASDDPPIENTPSETGGQACLERPDALERPPEGGLPCELIPPGLRLE